MGYKNITKCRCCGGTDLYNYLDLTDQPLANSYHKLYEELPKYPLQLVLCRTCFHNQLSVVVDPDEMFKNYLYVSGTTDTLKHYFMWFADFVTMQKTGDHKIPIVPGEPSVLDIACNDGSQLAAFPTFWKRYGVDPAENLVPLFREKLNSDVLLCVNYWSSEVAQELRKMRDGKGIDIIIAQNVFAHTDDIELFLLACKEIMDDSSDLYIQTSQAKMFDENQFDTIYHEHLSFFNTNSMKTIVERCGLYLNDVILTNIHGISYVFRIGKVREVDNFVQQTLESEKERGLYTVEKYEQFAKNANTIVSDLRDQLMHLKMDGWKIIGYGAAAKGMTLLNFTGITRDLISYIIDDNPLKIGLYTPGSDIFIIDKSALRTEEKIVIVPLAWNFFHEIRDRVKKAQNPNCEIKFVKYFPTIEVLD